MAVDENSADTAGESIEVTVLQSIGEGGATGQTTRASGDLQGDNFDNLLIGGANGDSASGNAAAQDGGYVVYVTEEGAGAGELAADAVLAVQLDMFTDSFEIEGDAITDIPVDVSEAGVYSTFTAEGAVIIGAEGQGSDADVVAETNLADDVVVDGAGFSGLTLVDVLDKASESDARMIFSYGEGNVAAGEIGGDRLEGDLLGHDLLASVPGIKFSVYDAEHHTSHGEFESLFLASDSFGLG